MCTRPATSRRLDPRRKHPKYQGGIMTTNVSILATGLANLASVTAAFERLGTTTSIVTDPAAVKEANRLVVPGVGHFGAAMRKLTALGLIDPLLARVRDGRPTLGICLGLQIFGKTSEESPEAFGLGWIPSPVTSFPSSVISPQMGWNKVLPSPESKFLEEAKNDLPKMITVQNSYSLLNRQYEVGNAEISMRENIGLLAYSPLACGVLSGKYINGTDQPNSRLNLFKRFVRYSSDQSTEATRRYLNLAQQFDISLTKMALAFVNQQPFVTSNIIGATTLSQLGENIESINVELSSTLIAEIEKIHQEIPDPST